MIEETRRLALELGVIKTNLDAATTVSSFPSWGLKSFDVQNSQCSPKKVMQSRLFCALRNHA